MQLSAPKQLNETVLSIQYQLLSRESMLSDDKQFPAKYKVYMNLVWLDGGVCDGAADDRGGADDYPSLRVA